MRTIYLVIRYEVLKLQDRDEIQKTNVQAYFDKNIAEDFARHMTNTCVNQDIQYGVTELDLITHYKDYPIL